MNFMGQTRINGQCRQYMILRACVVLTYCSGCCRKRHFSANARRHILLRVFETRSSSDHSAVCFTLRQTLIAMSRLLPLPLPPSLFAAALRIVSTATRRLHPPLLHGMRPACASDAERRWRRGGDGRRARIRSASPRAPAQETKDLMFKLNSDDPAKNTPEELANRFGPCPPRPGPGAPPPRPPRPGAAATGRIRLWMYGPCPPVDVRPCGRPRCVSLFSVRRSPQAETGLRAPL